MGNSRYFYTKEEKEWVRQNIKKYTYEELSNEFNKKFDRNTNKGTMCDLCTKRMKIHRETNPTTYKKGVEVRRKPLGIETTFPNGITYVKVRDNYSDGNPRKNYRKNWKPKHHIIYEQAFGKIPKGHIVIFLDKDRTNIDISNLACIPRKWHGIMCKNSWYYKNKTITLSRIKYLDWKEKLKERESDYY